MNRKLIGTLEAIAQGQMGALAILRVTEPGQEGVYQVQLGAAGEKYEFEIMADGTGKLGNRVTVAIVKDLPPQGRMS